MNEQTPEQPDTCIEWNWKRIGITIGLSLVIGVIILVFLMLLVPTVGTTTWSNWNSL